jgi:hypothetical protein
MGCMSFCRLPALVSAPETATAGFTNIADGNMELPQMTGFSIALLPGAVLAIELRGAEDGKLQGGWSLQIEVTPQFARELAVGLFEAIQAMDRPPTASKLN